MAESIKKNLFRLFGNMKKVNESVLTTSGIGLGLTICKKLTEFL